MEAKLNHFKLQKQFKVQKKQFKMYIWLALKLIPTKTQTSPTKYFKLTQHQTVFTVKIYK